MYPEPNGWNPSRRHLRYFAWLLALLLIGVTFSIDSPPATWSLRLAAAVVFSLGTVLPGTLRWLYAAFLIGLYPLLWSIRRAVPSLSYPNLKDLFASFSVPLRASLRRRLRPRSPLRRRTRPAAMSALRSLDKL